MDAPLRIVPANEASPEHLDAVFGARGVGARCRCQRYRLERGESFGGMPVEERIARQLEQTAAGDPDAATTSVLVAYLGDEPVGWVAVDEELHVGTVPTFAAAGLVEVSHPTKRRVVMRRDAG